MSQPVEVLRTQCKATDPSVWESFLKRFATTAQRVSFHPAAGRDLRSLIFQAKDRLQGRLDSARDHSSPAKLVNYETPNLWLFSEESSETCSFWEDSLLLFEDLRTRMEVMQRCHVTIEMHTDRSPKSKVDRPAALLKAIYLEVEITSDVAPLRRVDVLFVQAACLDLLESFVLPTQIPLSHCVLMGEETDAEGNALSLMYLSNLCVALKTEWIIVRADLYHGPRKRSPKLQAALSRYWTEVPRGLTSWPEEAGLIHWGQRQAMVLRFIHNRFYSLNIGLAELKGEGRVSPDGLYLHFCCEGWKSLGPVTSVGIAEGGTVLLDGMGVRIASHGKRGWKVHAPGFGSNGWETPIITQGHKHPHPSLGGHPHGPSR